MKTRGVVVIALVMCIALTGVAIADQITSTYCQSGSCNIVQAGSKYDLTVGSVVTSADNKFVGADATSPVTLNYAINVKPYTIPGQGAFPAMGTVSAYVKAHIQEGRTSNNTSRNEDLTYIESSSASGIINVFTQIIAFQSVKVLP
ncbi:MAG: hypothetical protein NTV68_02105 [Methanomicrobiales archaeon]|nr:hypothetical protein [Methanomicrobiales archaeon]